MFFEGLRRGGRFLAASLLVALTIAMAVSPGLGQSSGTNQTSTPGGTAAASQSTSNASPSGTASTPASKKQGAGADEPKTDARKARAAYEEGMKAERGGDWNGAFDKFSQAAEALPNDRNVKLQQAFARSEVVKGLAAQAEKEILAGQDDKARSTLAAALAIDPSYSIARERLGQIAAPPQPPAASTGPLATTDTKGPRLASGPPKLQNGPGTHSFDFRGTTRGAYQEIARQFGVTPTFDPDLTDRTIRFNVSDMDFDTAMRVLGEQTGTFWRSVDSKTFFVAADTPAKRRDYEPEVVQTIILPESETNDEMTETSRIVRDIVGLRRSDLDLQAHTLTVRDSLDNVALAEALVKEMEKPHGEALLDIDILEVDSQMARNMGITPPTSTQIFPITSSQVRQLEQAQNVTSLNQLLGSIFGSTLNGSSGALIPPLIAFGGGSVFFLATAPGASAQLLENASVVRSAQRVLMRVEDGRPATFFVGEHFPVTLALLSESLVAPGTNAVQIPSIGAASALAFPRTDYPVGNSPSGVAIGDFNGDGVPDLAVTNQADNTVSVLLGNGDGTFKAATTFPTGKAPIALVANDLRGNGMLDLAVVNNCTANATSSTPCAATDYSVSILLGNGDGTFQAPVNYTVGTSPVALISGTFHTTTTSALDLAVVNQGDNTVSLLTGNGDGTFKAKEDFAVGTGPTALTTADFNNDGFADLAVTNGGANTFSILLGRGNGTFTAQATAATGNGPSSIVAASLATGGQFDLAVTNKTDGTVSVFPGNGNGTFGAATVYTAGTQPNAVITVDVNQDGMPDLIVANEGSSDVSVFLGEGDGALAPAINLTVGNNPVALAAATLTSDGLQDLTVVNQAADTVSVILNNSAFLSLNPSAPQTPYPGSQYVDLGLKVKASPRMHPDNEVTLDLQFDISSLSGQNENGIPILSNRTIQQTVRLRDNQTSLLSGIIQSNEMNSISGLPGLAQAGPLGYLAGARNKQRSDTELVIAITPRQLRLVPREDHSLYAGRGEGTQAPAPLAPPPPAAAPPGAVPQPGQPGGPPPGSQPPGAPPPGAQPPGVPSPNNPPPA